MGNKIHTLIFLQCVKTKSTFPGYRPISLLTKNCSCLNTTSLHILRYSLSLFNFFSYLYINFLTS